MASPRKIIVTGSSGGIGRAAVQKFAREGESVAALVHSKALDEETLQSGDVTPYVCDVADRAAVHGTFDSIVARMGGLDVLIHAAGIDAFSPAIDVTDDELDRVLAVNVGGTVYCNQIAYAHMRQSGGGSIVNFQSMAGVRGFAGMPHYAASKGAVGAWTRVVASEWGADGVRVNAIAPITMTEMAVSHRASLGPEELQEHLAELRKVIHLNDGEFGDPVSDVFPVLRFLAGEDSRFVTGQTIAVDGGWMKLGS